MLKRVRAFAPATSANVSAGFDVFGFALDAPGDEVEITMISAPSARPRVRVDAVEGDGGRLPKDPARNPAGVAAQALLNAWAARTGAAPDVALVLRKGLPLGSGMGSSAASAAAAAIAANRLLGDPFSPTELVSFSMEGERVACGAAHADNVAPAVFGGFTLVRAYDPLDILGVPVPAELWAAVVHPDLSLPTAKARAALPAQYPRSVLVSQVGNAAALIAGLCASDYGLISRSLRDLVAEPYRSPLIPGFEDAKAAAVAAGALGAGISGSGPSVFALARGEAAAKAAGEAARAAFAERGTAADFWACAVASGGPRILLEE